MKVIYDSYLRRNRSNASQGSNNNNNGHNIEICHPNDFSKNGSNRESTADSLAGPNCRHMIPYESLVINKELGIGEFGVVQQGVWTNEKGCRIQVAIKCLSAARLENNRLEFLKEASIMHSISHEHIVALYGVVLEPSIMLVTELAPLRSLLECLKESALVSHFPVSSLCTFAAQIADGMDYLESKRLIHRDLAARNILVFNKDKVKISDFGLSRALGVGKDYYQSNFNVNLKLPIAWCAPECINYLKFTSQSDVWAYGVTLWEMFSFGFQPWAALTGQQILEAIDKPNYQRLEQPECCPKEYYQLMLKCWTHEPHLRPKFSEIVHQQPDCKPELLRAIRNSVLCGSQKEFLQYKIGDIITVIDKVNESQETLTGSYWKGVTNERKTGFFNPSDFVTYLGQNLPSSNNNSNANSSSSTSFVQHFLSGSSLSSNSSNGHHSNNHSSFASTFTSTVLQSSKFIRGLIESKSHHNNHVSPHGTRKKSVRPEISKPQGDFKHTGHVGADGIFFGDIPFMEGKYQQVPRHSASNSLDGNDPMAKVPAISHPITSFRNNSAAISNKQLEKYLEENHEYHEISDEEDLGPLESPPFEVLDFGPSLMEEVFRVLDQIKPELNNETAETEKAINENGINVKNEVQELNLKICKEVNLKKKQSSVKPISEAEQNELDSAIAMAKDIANRTMLEDELDLAKSDSPKTPNSPNKRKFSFKFPSHKSSPKGERRTFSEETESIGNIIESITPAAKEAYLSLVEKGVSSTASNSSTFNKKEHFDKRPDVKPPPPPQAPQAPTIAPVVIDPSSGSMSASNLVNEMDNNPLRMLRTAGIGKVLRPKVRGNRSFSQPRLPTTAQTAGLARVASSRSQLGSPPPVPNHEDQSLSSQITANNNALPLPPRDRTRPLIQLKTHQRRHPLVIPVTGLNGVGDNLNGYSTSATCDDLNYDPARHDSPPLVHRHVPVLKQVSCPQAPAAFLSVYNKQTNIAATNNNANNNNNNNNCTSFTNNDCDRPSAAIPPSKPNRTYLSDDLTESLENEIQKAFDNIKLSQSADNIADNISDNEDCVQTETKYESKELVKPVESSSIKAAIIKPNYSSVINSSLPTKNNTQPQNGVISSSNGSSFTPNIISTADSNHQPPVMTNSVSNGNGNTTTTTEFSMDVQGTVTGNHKRSVDSDEVRVMLKVLGNEANLSVEECATILDSTDWDIHKAIKCVRFRQQLHSHNINVDCDLAQMLAKFNWNTRQASNYLIATQGVPEDTTEV